MAPLLDPLLAAAFTLAGFPGYCGLRYWGERWHGTFSYFESWCRQKAVRLRLSARVTTLAMLTGTIRRFVPDPEELLGIVLDKFDEDSPQDAIYDPVPVGLASSPILPKCRQIA